MRAVDPARIYTLVLARRQMFHGIKHADLTLSVHHHVQLLKRARSLRANRYHVAKAFI